MNLVRNPDAKEIQAPGNHPCHPSTANKGIIARMVSTCADDTMQDPISGVISSQVSCRPNAHISNPQSLGLSSAEVS